jgi:hypothetical protein
MLYDFVLTNGDDRGSLRPVRTYSTKKSLSKDFIENINEVLAQALEATGRLENETEFAFVSFDPAWVEEKSSYDETLQMRLADDWMIGSNTPLISTTNARKIAHQLLTDFASTDDWAYIFSEDEDAFSKMDFDDFELIDNTVNNEALKVPVGSNVYVRNWNETVYVYQGRPSKQELKNGYDPAYQHRNVWASDENVIAVDDFKVSDYNDQMEVFPLPLDHRDKYFAREKSKSRSRKEAYGTTQKQAKLRLALMLAFEALSTSPE